ncbi:DUF445 domain-containing protein [Thioalkalivibrio sp. HK1]|uniref:DUF445 domain-containing protein n=1 Tax=Thioalkalivibrio sp. HK1 TaxID=1469245 RepID=UPI000472DE0A|nr:DUF445 domain-containing protein [Thioalkalivibrio sp. HK1]
MRPEYKGRVGISLIDNNAEPVDHNMDDLNRTTRLRRLSAPEKRRFIIAFLKVIMPDSQPQPLGQDEKDCLLRVVSDLSILPDDRQELLHWAFVKSTIISEISEAKQAFGWVDKELKKYLLIDIFAYLDTNNGRSRKGKIIASDHFKELCREFTDDEISSLRKDANRESHKTEEEIKKEIVEVESDIKQNEEIQISEDSNDRNEKTTSRSNDEKPDQDEDDPHRMKMKESLRKAKRVATGLLVAMAAMFIAHYFFIPEYLGHGIVMAFTAAAMIGGLADWYAVTALFRQPLYIPEEKIKIPHTAIIPKRKDEIGKELANFVKDKILVKDVVEEQLRHSDLTHLVGEWLQDEANAKRLDRDFSEIIKWFRSTDSSELLGGFKRILTEKIAQRIPANKALAAIIDVLASGNNTQVIIDELTQFGLHQIEGNREAILNFIRKNIKKEGGWFKKMMRSIGEKIGFGITDENIDAIYTEIESKCKQLLREIRNDQEHPVRIEFNNRLRSWHEKLINDKSVAKKSDHLLGEFLRNETVQDFFQSLWEKTRDALYAELMDESSDIRRSIEREIQNIGKKLSGDANLRKSLNNWLGEFITKIVVNHSDQISKAISDTIKKWDPKTTAESIELQIGRDLQWIRINGTVVGGLIGILIYLLTGFHH